MYELEYYVIHLYYVKFRVTGQWYGYNHQIYRILEREQII